MFGKGVLDCTPDLTQASLFKWQNGQAPSLLKTYVGINDFGVNLTNAYVASFSEWGTDLLLFTVDSAYDLWVARISSTGEVEQKRKLGVRV